MGLDPSEADKAFEALHQRVTSMTAPPSLRYDGSTAILLASWTVLAPSEAVAIGMTIAWMREAASHNPQGLRDKDGNALAVMAEVLAP